MALRTPAPTGAAGRYSLALIPRAMENATRHMPMTLAKRLKARFAIAAETVPILFKAVISVLNDANPVPSDLNPQAHLSSHFLRAA